MLNNQQKSSTAVGEFQNEASFIALGIESNQFGENQLNSTPVAGTSGEAESLTNANLSKDLCPKEPVADAELSTVKNEISEIQEQCSDTSSQRVDSLRRSSLFEPNEQSTPVGERKLRKLSCTAKMVMDEEEIRKSSGVRPLRVVSYFYCKSSEHLM